MKKEPYIKLAEAFLTGMASRGQHEMSVSSSQQPVIDEQLLAAWVEGRLTKSENHEVEASIRTSAEAQNQAAQYLLLVRDTPYGKQLLSNKAGHTTPGIQSKASTWGFPLTGIFWYKSAFAVLLVIGSAMGTSYYLRATAPDARIRISDSALPPRVDSQKSSEQVLSSDVQPQVRPDEAHSVGQDYLRQSAQLLNEGSYDAAAALADRAVSTQPRNEKILAQAATLHLKLARTSRGIPPRLGEGFHIGNDFAFAAKTADEPEPVDAYTRSAEQYFEEALQLNSDYVPALKGLAEVQVELGQFDLAAKTVSRARTLAPQNVDVLNVEGMLYLKSGNLDQAEKTFSGIISQQPDFVPAHANLAKLYQLQENEDKSRRQREMIKEPELLKALFPDDNQ